MPITTNPPGISPFVYTHNTSADVVFQLAKGSDGSITETIHETWTRSIGSLQPPPIFGDATVKYSAQEVAAAENAIALQVSNFYGDQLPYPDTSTKDDFTALLVHDVIVAGRVSYAEAAKCYASAKAQDGTSFMSHVLVNPAVSDGSYSAAIAAVQNGQVAMVKGNDMKIAGLYAAFFGRAPDAAGLAYWQAQMQGGGTLHDIAKAFSGNSSFQTHFGGLDNAGYVAALYTNMLGGVGDTAGMAYWTSHLNSGAVSRTDLAADLISSAMDTDLEGALAAGTMTRADHDAALVRQNTLLNKAQLGLYFAHATYYMGAVARTDDTDHLYHASELTLSKISANPQTELTLENMLYTYANSTDALVLEGALVTLVGTMAPV